MLLKSTGPTSTKSPLPSTCIFPSSSGAAAAVSLFLLELCELYGGG